MPKQKREKIIFNISPFLSTALKDYADKSGESKSSIIRKGLRVELEKEGYLSNENKKRNL